jgi:hypothetical protein
MGDRTTPARFRGLVRPDAGMTWLDSESGHYTAGGVRVSAMSEASPRTGIASPDQSTDMALRASGEQSEDMEIVCNRRGLPGLDEMSYLWRNATDSTIQLRGCDLPVPAAAWEPIDLTNSRYDFHIISTPDDYLVVCYQDFAGVTYTRTKAPGATSWGSEVTVDTSTIPDGYPCLLVLPRVDGYRLILYRWTDIASDYSVRGYYSDDQGATWTNDGLVLLSSIDVTTYATRGRLRAAYYNGQILLIGHLVANDTTTDIERDRIVQWASSDGGGRFSRIVISDGLDTANAGAFPDLCVWRGQFVLGRLIYDSGVGGVVAAFRMLATAWNPWTSGSDTSDTSGLTSGQFWGVYVPGGGAADQYISVGELALWVDDVHAVYAASRHCAGTDQGAHPIVRSATGTSPGPGSAPVWTVMGDHQTYPGGNNGSVWWNTGAPGAFTSVNNELYGITGCHHRARGVIVSSFQVAGAGKTNKYFAIYLGGWQSIPMPGLNQTMTPTTRGAWDHNGAAYHRPSQSIWAYTTSGGTETEALGPNGTLDQATPGGGGEYIWNTYAQTTTVAQGTICEHHVDVDNGTAYVEVINGNGAAIEYNLQVRITPTFVVLYDLNTPGTIASLAYTGTSVRVRLAVRGSSVICWAMSIGLFDADQTSSTLSDRLWTVVGSIPTATNGGGALAAQIRFGIAPSSAASWMEWMFSAGKYTGNGLYTLPDRLRFGRSLTESPSWAGNAVKLAAVTGPAATGDTWQIEASAEYPVEAMLPTISPSPRHPHRTNTFTAAPATVVEARWTWTVAAADQQSTSVRWAALLDGLEIPEAEIHLYYSGAYHLAGSVGYWTFAGVKTGEVIRCNSGGALNTAVIRRDELVGCVIEEVTGGTVSAARAYVTANEPGFMNTSAGNSLNLVVTCDDLSSFGNSPTVRIHPRRALMVLDLEALSETFSRIQIRAPFNLPAVGAVTAPGWPANGYAEIGTFAAGPLWAWGTTHSWGYRLATDPDTELTTAEDGTRIPYQRAPIRRRWSLSWSDPVAMHEMYDSSPDYISADAAGKAAAFHRSTPVDVADQLRSLAGSSTVVVYCPAIDSGGTGRPDRWADGAALARIVSSVEIDNVVGDENRDEVGRVQELTLEEEV